MSSVTWLHVSVAVHFVTSDAPKNSLLRVLYTRHYWNFTTSDGLLGYEDVII